MKAIVVAGLSSGIHREKIFHIAGKVWDLHWWCMSCWKYLVSTAASANDMYSVFKHPATGSLVAQWLISQTHKPQHHNLFNIYVNGCNKVTIK